VTALARRARLVTLVGPAGSGKTRLALEVGRRLAQVAPSGSVLVELAPLKDGRAIPQAFASSLGIVSSESRPLDDLLLERLEAFDGVIVVDNCEHLVDASAGIIHRILGACPTVMVLATSREALRVDGERVWPVPTLSGLESALLFVDRAQRVWPNFKLMDANESRVSAICRHLDGLPLAIELAAARVSTLTLETIESHLKDRFRLLTINLRTAPPRHQTLRAAIDWSYDLLSTPERLLFVRLGVFAGSFDRAAVEAVCAGESVEKDEVLDLVGRLVDKSLVEAHDERYRLLETLRAYALERLGESQDVHTLSRAHAEYFSRLGVDDCGRYLPFAPDDADNFREALRWSQSADPALHLKLCCGFAWHCQHSGLLTEGRLLLEEALQSPIDDSSRARAHSVLSVLAWRQADSAGAESHAMKEVALRRGLDDSYALARSLGNLAFIRIGAFDLVGAEIALAEEMSVVDELEDQPLRGEALFHAGLLAAHQGRLEYAQSRLEESARSLITTGRDEDQAPVDIVLGWVRLRLGDLAGAQEAIERALRVAVRAGHISDAATLMDEAAEVAFLRRSFRRAMVLKGAADAISLRGGPRARAMATTSRARWVGQIQRKLGNDAMRAWTEGKSLSFEEAARYALGDDRNPVPNTKLTSREREIARLVKTGITNSEIAVRLGMAKRTVDAHLDHIRIKLGVRSRVEIANWIIDQMELAASLDWNRIPSSGT
jgi:predicted ATPase/DNA-binding CsgD family transcriptional regulator